jgi:hypothetical protein
MVVAAGKTGGPGLVATLGASFEVVAVKLVKAGVGQIQFVSGLSGGKFSLPMRGQKVADERSGLTFDELRFFMVGE